MKTIGDGNKMSEPTNEELHELEALWSMGDGDTMHDERKFPLWLTLVVWIVLIACGWALAIASLWVAAVLWASGPLGVVTVLAVMGLAGWFVITFTGGE